jgi:putative iron-dependent peroxidase
MTTSQAGILADVPAHSRYLEFNLVADGDPASGLRALVDQDWDDRIVIGLGAGLVQKLGGTVSGLRTFPAMSGPGCEVPSTPADIWCWVRGDDRGEILHLGRSVVQRLGAAFRIDRNVDGFKYDIGRDLSGYEDGTENPDGDDAVEAAVAAGDGADAGFAGSSFVAVQQWVHDLDHLEGLSQDERDDIIGRRQSDNEEFEEAPPSAHVKRTAQESFDPEAFVVRRSMPFTGNAGDGLMFVAFGHSFDAFEAQMRRMAGLEDEIVDGLFRFSRPISGSYFWCPPVTGGRLDLSALSI